MAKAQEDTPKGTPKSAKKTAAKLGITNQGFKYLLGNTRKDGSEMWKCSEKECEGRLLKKGDMLKLLKPHSIQNNATSGVLQHMFMYFLKERALKHPEEGPTDVMRRATSTVTEFVIASVPSPKELQSIIKEWREQPLAEPRKVNRTPKAKTPNGDNVKIKLPKSSRKRLKLASEEKDSNGGGEGGENDDDEEEEEDFAGSKSKNKRSRSRSVELVSDDGEEEEEEEDDSEEE